jgi:Ricin-type beta-trefoil lectin domain
VPMTRKLLVTLATPLLCLAVLAATAFTAPSASPTTYFRMYGTDGGGLCLVQTGTTDSVYVTNAACSSTNHSVYWAVPAENGQGHVVNEHSGMCLTANDAGDVYMDTCGTNHVQLWNRIKYSAGGMSWDLFQNVHTGGDLWIVTGDSVEALSGCGACDYGFDFWVP